MCYIVDEVVTSFLFEKILTDDCNLALLLRGSYNVLRGFLDLPKRGRIMESDGVVTLCDCFILQEDLCASRIPANDIP